MPPTPSHDRPRIELRPGILHRDGVTVHYASTRPVREAAAPSPFAADGAARADGSAVVLTHGAVLDHHCFDAQVDALAPHHRVIVWDLPGHGSSSAMPRGFRVADAASLLRAILDQEGIERAHLVGQSMGGDVVQEFLFRFPERARRVALLGCVCITRGRTGLGDLWARWSTLKLRLVPLRRFRLQVAATVGVRRETQEYGARCLAAMSRSALVATWDAIAHAPHEEPQYRLPVPTLLLVGARDAVGGGLVVAGAEAWAAREPQMRRITVPDAGHVLTMDAPERVNQELVRFLGE